MGKPGQTSLEFMFQKSQPLSNSQKQMVWLPQSQEALHAPADVSPRAACLCAGLGTRLRQLAGGECSSAPQADVHLPMPSCRGQVRYSASPCRFNWEAKHELAASCLQRNMTCPASLWELLLCFWEVVVPTKKTLQKCLAVLGESTKAEGLCLYYRKFASWAPTLRTGAWKKSIANHTHLHRTSAGTEVKYCVTHHHVVFYSSSSSRFFLFLLTPTVPHSPATAEVA